MVKTTAMLLDELSQYRSPKTKLSRMVERSECFPIVKGLYETDRNVPAHTLAASIYGPSYISFEYALGYYDLIPEAVYAVTSATFEKRKTKSYKTLFGNYTFQDVPSTAFPAGLRVISEGEYSFRIAEPEKALCDQLYKMSPVPSAKALMELLVEDLRISESDLRALDHARLESYSALYQCTNMKHLQGLLRRRFL